MAIRKLSTSRLGNNVWYKSMLAGNAAYVPPGNYELLETVIVPSGGQASVTFSNLNSSYGSTYQHLHVRISARTTQATAFTSNRVRLNSDTGNNYAFQSLIATVGLQSEGYASQSYFEFGQAAGTSWATGNFPASIVDITDPFETTKNTTIRSLGGGMNGSSNFNYLIALQSGLWNNTNAITTMLIYPGAGEYIEGSRFSLYGIRSINA